MKKIFLILLVSIIAMVSYGQTYNPIFVPRSGPALTAQDYRLAAKLNFYLPHTRGLTLNGGLDTLGAVIYDDSSKHIWFRDSTVGGGHKWSMLLKTGDANSGITALNNGLTLTGSTGQLGGSLIQNVTIDANTHAFIFDNLGLNFFFKKLSLINSPTANYQVLMVDSISGQVRRVTTQIIDTIGATANFPAYVYYDISSNHFKVQALPLGIWLVANNNIVLNQNYRGDSICLNCTIPNPTYDITDSGRLAVNGHIGGIVRVVTNKDSTDGRMWNITHQAGGVSHWKNQWTFTDIGSDTSLQTGLSALDIQLVNSNTSRHQLNGGINVAYRQNVNPGLNGSSPNNFSSGFVVAAGDTLTNPVHFYFNSNNPSGYIQTQFGVYSVGGSMPNIGNWAPFFVADYTTKIGGAAYATNVTYKAGHLAFNASGGAMSIQKGVYAIDSIKIMKPSTAASPAFYLVQEGDSLIKRIAYTSPGGGNTNSNVGIGYRFALPNTNNIKTLLCVGCTLDSTSNANTITLTVAGSSSTLQQILTNGSILTTANTITNTGQILSFTGGTYKFNGLLTDTTNLAYVLFKKKDSSMAEITPALLSAYFPPDSLPVNNGLSIGVGNIGQIGGPLVQNTNVSAHNAYTLTLDSLSAGLLLGFLPQKTPISTDSMLIVDVSKKVWKAVIPSGGGSVASVSNSDGTLTITPTTGPVVASLALGHANTWTAAQTVNAAFVTNNTVNLTGLAYSAGGATFDVITQDTTTGKLWRQPYYAIDTTGYAAGSTFATYNGTKFVLAVGGSGVTSVGTFSGSSIAKGASISGTAITFGPADGTNPGMIVASGAQTLGATITFTNAPVLTTSSTTGYVWTATDGAGHGTWSPAAGGGTSPGGSTTQFQYNNGGAFGGAGGFVWDNTNSGVKLNSNAIGVTPANAKGLYLQNSTAATAGNQQYSPGLVFEGNGWKTNATAASQLVNFREYLGVVQGAANPSFVFEWDGSINGAGYANLMNLNSGGQLNVSSSISAGGTIAATGNVTATVAVGAGATSFFTWGSGSTQPNLLSDANYNMTLRNGTNANELWVDNTWSSSTNYEAGVFGFIQNANILSIGTKIGSSGTLRNIQFIGGTIGMGIAPSASAELTLLAGTTTKAPLLLTSGTNLTSVVNGAIEYNGTHFFGSVGGIRQQLDQQTLQMAMSASSTMTTNNTISSGTNFFQFQGTGALLIGQPLIFSGTAVFDANYTITTENVLQLKGAITANRTITLPDANGTLGGTGRIIYIDNGTTNNTFTWSLAGTGTGNLITDPAGNAISTLPFGTSYTLVSYTQGWRILSKETSVITPGVVGLNDMTGQTGSVSGLVTYAVPGSGGFNSFQVGGYMTNLATAVTDVTTLRVFWTDETNTSRTTDLQTITPLTAVGIQANAEMTIRVKQGTTITMSTVLTTSGGTTSYDVGAHIIQLY